MGPELQSTELSVHFSTFSQFFNTERTVTWPNDLLQTFD